MFFALFATVYGWLFELRSPSEKQQRLKKEKTTAIKLGMAHQLKRAAGTIKTKKVSEPVLKALRGATTDASARRSIIRYLAGSANDPFAR
jgi:hypothetical protein